MKACKAISLLSASRGPATTFLTSTVSTPSVSSVFSPAASDPAPVYNVPAVSSAAAAVSSVVAAVSTTTSAPAAASPFANYNNAEAQPFVVVQSSTSTAAAASSTYGASPGGLSGKATTTHYYDGLMGACGCGSGNSPFSWQAGLGNGIYTAAGSQAFFDNSGSSWCGSGCGKCFQVTTTGESACDGCGDAAQAGQSIILMVTNLCPYVGNENWCPNPGNQNNYGYSYHFDIMAQQEVIGSNPVVEFQEIACPATASSSFSQCECA